ncbi:MAG: LamG-like jellyroll fold domain-containing protein [Owenweeksia sp.]|nr:LamG-like jellyroll fold domain-containing protein [Owenweeksia sp.]
MVYDSAAATDTSYVNGVQNNQVQVDSVPDITGSGLILGGYLNNKGLNGLLDEFRWYSRALSPLEISNTHNVDLNIRGNCNPFSYFRMDTVMATGALFNWTPGTGNQAYYMSRPGGLSTRAGHQTHGVCIVQSNHR